MAKLFIVGFPKDFQEIALVELFSFHGTVNTVTLVTDQATGQPKGYGFVTMTDDAGANRAIAALDGTTIGGRTISVRFAEEKPVDRPVVRRDFKQRPSPPKANFRQPAVGETPKPKRPRRPL